MKMRAVIAGALTCAALGALPMWAQQKPAADGVPGSIEQEVKGLTADDFAQREAAVKKLEALISEQIKQRAAVQDVLRTLQKELSEQQRDLAMVTDEESQAQVAGLLEMERGLSSWTIQTMAEGAQKRKALLAWGLSKDGAPLAAKVYSENKRTRLDAIKELAKVDGDGASWTLSRLINDNDPAIRAGAMAAAWSRKPQTDVVDALWFRAVAGPLSQVDHRGTGGPKGMMAGIDDIAVGDADTIKVDIPDGGDPMEFDTGDSATEFTDAQLAGSVLVHLKAPEIGDKIRAVVAERIKAGKDLAPEDEMELMEVMHWMVEAYEVKEAVPMLASEALDEIGEQNMGEVNGQMFSWTTRTTAIGTLAKLVGKEPGDFGLKHVNNVSGERGWRWAVEFDPANMANVANPNEEPQPDGAAVRSFYTWWKANHATYGVKEEPSNTNVPPEPGQQPRRGGGGFRGGRGGVTPFNPGGPMQPAPAPANAPGSGAGAQGAVPGGLPGVMPGGAAPDMPLPGATGAGDVPAGNDASPPIAPPVLVPIVPSRNRPPIRGGAAG